MQTHTASPEISAPLRNECPGIGVTATQRAQRYFAYFLVFATLCLIFLGGQVKSHNAGLAVPDWPWTFGENPITYAYDKWVGGIFHEHLHRLVAGCVAALTMLLAGWFALREPREGQRELAYLAVGAVLLQAVLGGMTVLLHLPPWVSSSHALLAQTFLVILTIIAYRSSAERAARDEAAAAGRAEPRTPLLTGALILIAALYIQLLLGALVRHTGAGLAIPDFPTTAGRLLPAFNDESLAWINDWRLEHSFDTDTGIDLPPVTLGQVALHFAHRAGALVISALALLLAAIAWRRRAEHPALWRAMLLILALLAAQITLGATVIWTAKEPLYASLHVAVGAATLAASVLLLLRAWPVRLPPHVGVSPAGLT